MRLRRFVILDKDSKVLTDAQHLEEAKHKLYQIKEAYAIYDTKRGYVRMLKFDKAVEKTP